jgi:hypothetical protein
MKLNYKGKKRLHMFWFKRLMVKEMHMFKFKHVKMTIVKKLMVKNLKV